MTSSRPTIMVLDTDVATREFLMTSLAGQFNIICQPHLFGCIKQIETFNVEVILHGHHRSLTRAFRENASTKNIPIISMGVDTSNLAFVLALHAGADQHVTKPLMPTDIAQRIAHLISTRKKA
jgi:DNA-binding response OmpR family regulator